MTDEERRIISDFVTRIAGAGPAGPAGGQGSGPWGGSSVPATRPALPPVDREADQLIADLFTRHPEARYRITQTAFVQEAALVEANNRIRQLEWEVENAQRQAQAPQRGGMFGGMFGGGRQQQQPMTPPPQPVYPPGYNPQALQQGRGGMGFLGTAVAAAAGVAGGMVLGNMLMGAMGGGGAHAATAAGSAGGFGQEAVPTSSAWTDPGTAAADQGWTSGGGSDAYAAPESDVSQASYDSGGYDDAGGYDEEA